MQQVFSVDRYALELAELMTSKVIKLSCGVCGVKPSTNEQVLYINEYGVCKKCMDTDHLYQEVEESKCN